MAALFGFGGPNYDSYRIFFTLSKQKIHIFLNIFLKLETAVFAAVFIYPLILSFNVDI